MTERCIRFACPTATDSLTVFRTIYSGRRSITDRGAVAPRIGAAHAHAGHRVDGDAVCMAGEFAEIRPAICRVSPPLELLHGFLGKAAFDVEQVSRFAHIEAPREPARHLARLLDFEATIHEHD